MLPLLEVVQPKLLFLMSLKTKKQQLQLHKKRSLHLSLSLTPRQAFHFVPEVACVFRQFEFRLGSGF